MSSLSALLPRDAPFLVSVSAWAMLVTAAMTFVATMFIKAPYGRYSSAEQAKTWGPLIPARLAWLLMETPTLWTAALMLWSASERQAADGRRELLESPVDLRPGRSRLGEPANMVLLGLFLLHYAQRSLVFPLCRMAGQGSPMPISVMLMAFLFCLWNGLMQSASLVWCASFPAEWLSRPPFLLGAAVFLLGFLGNVHADQVLINLRRSRTEEQKEPLVERQQDPRRRYKIPHGGLYAYISCPNYFWECVEWLGFSVACGLSLPSAAFAVYTASNLVPRAVKHHEWYLETFGEEYRRLGRRAVIPGVW